MSDTIDNDVSNAMMQVQAQGMGAHAFPMDLFGYHLGFENIKSSFRRLRELFPTRALPIDYVMLITDYLLFCLQHMRQKVIKPFR